MSTEHLAFPGGDQKVGETRPVDVRSPMLAGCRCGSATLLLAWS
jgi:hypothetical protein